MKQQSAVSYKEQKNIIRKKYIQIRDSVVNKESINNELCNKILTFLALCINDKSIVAGYYKFGSEPDIMSVLQKLHNHNINIALPRFKANQSQGNKISEKLIMQFATWDFQKNSLKDGVFGIQEPISEDFIIPDIVLTPLVAFNKRCHRIGYGMGHYDQVFGDFIEKNAEIIKIGCAFSSQECNDFIEEKHDIALDYIITEKYMIKKCK